MYCEFISLSFKIKRGKWKSRNVWCLISISLTCWSLPGGSSAWWGAPHFTGPPMRDVGQRCWLLATHASMLGCAPLCEGRGPLTRAMRLCLLLCCVPPAGSCMKISGISGFLLFWGSQYLISFGHSFPECAGTSCCLSGCSDSSHYHSWNLHVFILGKANTVFVNVLLSEFSLC